MTTEFKTLLDEIEGYFENSDDEGYVRRLLAVIKRQSEALKFYSSTEAMSCRLRSKFEDVPACLKGDSDYFQDPADLPILQDGGNFARQALQESIEILKGGKG